MGKTVGDVLAEMGFESSYSFGDFVLLRRGSLVDMTLKDKYRVTLLVKDLKDRSSESALRVLMELWAAGSST